VPLPQFDNALAGKHPVALGGRPESSGPWRSRELPG